MRRLLMLLALCGRAAALACGAGQFENTTAAQCQACVGNSYCPVGVSCTNACLPCVSGSWADASRSSCVSGACVPCAPGSWCNGNTSVIACPAGTFNAQVGLATSACSWCVPGTYAPSANLSACLRCAPGSVMAAKQATACLACPAGAYATGSGLLVCASCGVGQFGVVTNATSAAAGCVGCFSGTYGPGVGLTACTLCGYGTYAMGVGTESVAGCIPCAPGTYSTASGLGGNCTACAPGTYAPTSGLYQCVKCLNGTYLNASGAVSASQCAACPMGASTLDVGASAQTQCLCLAGYYGPPGGPCAPCAAASYSTAPNASACTLCERNTYGLPESLKTSSAAACTPCDALYGFTPAPGALQCSCNAGYFVNVAANQACDPCPRNTYGVAGAFTECYACTNGYTPTGVGVRNASECWCNPGHYLVGAPNVCALCAAGPYYCAGGPSAGQTACPAFFTVNQDGQANVSACTCVPGYYMTLSNTSARACNPCPIGSWCAGSDALPTACPSNMTTNLTGGALNVSQCFCKPGYQRVNNASIAAGCALCPSNQVCLSGVVSPCTANSYAPAGSSDAAACLCVPGYYPDTPASCARCPVDTYCLGGGLNLTRCVGNASTKGNLGSMVAAACVCLDGYYALSAARVRRAPRARTAASICATSAWPTPIRPSARPW